MLNKVIQRMKVERIMNEKCIINIINLLKENNTISIIDMQKFYKNQVMINNNNKCLNKMSNNNNNLACRLKFQIKKLIKLHNLWENNQINMKAIKSVYNI